MPLLALLLLREGLCRPLGCLVAVLKPLGGLDFVLASSCTTWEKMGLGQLAVVVHDCERLELVQLGDSSDRRERAAFLTPWASRDPCPLWQR